MNEMYLPQIWKNNERVDKTVFDYLWFGDHYLTQVCAMLTESRVHDWKVKPNTQFLIGAICESSLYYTQTDLKFSHPDFEIRAIPTFTNGKVRSVELTVADNGSDKIHVYATLTPTIDGWVWKDMMPNPILQMMMR